jgi:hypothetical protein
MKRSLLICALMLLAIAPAFAADSPWVGTWKLDPSKSHFTGDTFTYSKASNGMMHFSDGSTINYDFAIDGKPYKAAYDRSVVWTAAGNDAWNSTMTSPKGVVLYKAHHALSADGKTLNLTYTGTKPDGSTFNDTFTYTRLTGTKGLEGKWRSTKVNITAPDTFIVSAPSPGVLHWEIPGYKETVEGKADGTDHPITGPTVPPGLTLAFRLLSSHKLSYVIKNNGKPDGYGVQTLAADGKSFTDVSWSPGKMSEKSTGYYAKQ